MSNIMISLAAEWKGRAAFGKAGKSVSTLEKQVNKLGKQFASVFAVQKVYAFGKASAQAFMEDEKQAAKLANTINNLGMGFANPVIATYINQLQKLTGVADTELRPALQSLIQQTGSLAKSQEILNLAIEVSRGSGESLTTVTNDLAQAYVGNTRGLRKYYLGLTQAELKTMSFAQVQERLSKQFSGANAAYLKTYAGQMQLLTTAAGEAQETIGKGLIDSVALLGKDGSVEDLAQSMQDLADFTSNAIYGIASLTSELKGLGVATPSWLKSLFNNTVGKTPIVGVVNALKDLSAYGAKKQNAKLENPSTLMFKQDMANMRLGKEKAKNDQKILDATKKNTAELKKQAALKKQSALFDLEKIGIAAALQGKITEEEKLRLNLQMALLTDNDVLAAKLSAQLADSIDSTGKLKTWLATLPDANNPFKGWDTWLEGFTERMRATIALAATGSSTGRGESFPSLSPTVQDLVSGAVTGRAGSTAAGDVYVTVQGSVLSEQDLVAAVQNGLQLNSLSGKPSDIGRIAGMFG